MEMSKMEMSKDEMSEMEMSEILIMCVLCNATFKSEIDLMRHEDKVHIKSETNLSDTFNSANGNNLKTDETANSKLFSWN